METEYLDEEQVIALYNKVRTGKRTWPTGIWTSPAALQYAVTVFDYWIHNVMGWKGGPEARGKVTPPLLEEHRLADLVERVFVPEFGDDWLDFEIVLNESMRLSEDEAWAPDVADRQERVESAFEHAFEQLIGSSKQQPKLLPTYHRFRNHLLRMWSAFQEAQAEHDKAERESAERFWAPLRLVRSTRGQAAEAWSIVNADDERRGEVTVVWGEPHPYCLVIRDDAIEAGRRRRRCGCSGACVTTQRRAPAPSLPCSGGARAGRCRGSRLARWSRAVPGTRRGPSPRATPTRSPFQRSARGWGCRGRPTPVLGASSRDPRSLPASAPSRPRAGPWRRSDVRVRR